VIVILNVEMARGVLPVGERIRMKFVIVDEMFGDDNSRQISFGPADRRGGTDPIASNLDRGHLREQTFGR
jgi:hypothetical protein